MACTAVHTELRTCLNSQPFPQVSVSIVHRGDLNTAGVMGTKTSFLTSIPLLPHSVDFQEEKADMKQITVLFCLLSAPTDNTNVYRHHFVMLSWAFPMSALCFWESLCLSGLYSALSLAALPFLHLMTGISSSLRERSKCLWWRGKKWGLEKRFKTTCRAGMNTSPPELPSPAHQEDLSLSS